MKTWNRYFIGIAGGVAALTLGSGIGVILWRRRHESRKGR
jgi:hypothetical protein